MSRPFFTMGTFLLILLGACSKSHSPQPGLMGQWRLINITGGIAGGVVDYGPSVLQLQPDSSYTIKYSWPTSTSGTYSISINRVGITSDTVISFRTGSYTYQKLLQLNNLQLKLIDIYVSDGYTETYTKL